MNRSLLVTLLFGLCSICSAADKKPVGLGSLYYLLDRACASGDELAVEMLLDAGADPTGLRGYAAFNKSRHQFGLEPMWHLVQASFGGHTAIVNRLLRAGADPNLACGEGETALIVATRNGHIEVVRLLLSAGANRDYKSSEGTAAEIAANKKHADILKLLQTTK